MNHSPNHYDAIIIGGGGAGLMCAATAGQRGRRVLLLDHAGEVGKKILISGGGRCNFTNIYCAPNRFISNNPHFVKSALSRYRPQDFIALVDAYDIKWHEKTLGQLFCDGPARQIVAMLVAECAKGDVEIRLGRKVESVNFEGGLYKLECGGDKASAPSLVIATGGASIPKMGATGFAYDLARQFALKVVEPRPALVPLTLHRDDNLFTALAGISTDVTARFGKTEFREAALFTHKGLSGPAILQISSYLRAGATFEIDFLPDRKPGWLLALKNAKPRIGLKAALSDHLAERLAAALAEKLGLSLELANIPNAQLQTAEQMLARWPFTPSGSEGFDKAEVTVGGIDTDGLSSQSMMAKLQPGLYAIGEAVDVTGWLGGYNFQWAWASGRAAGLAL